MQSINIIRRYPYPKIIFLWIWISTYKTIFLAKSLQNFDHLYDVIEIFYIHYGVTTNQIEHDLDKIRFSAQYYEVHYKIINTVVSAASGSISSIVGYFIYPFIMQSLGRKMVFLLLNANLIIGWLVFVFAKSIHALFIGRIIQGCSKSGLFINAIIVAEYSHPSKRGYLCSIKKVMGGIGVLICHALAFKFGWREITLVALVPATLSFAFSFLWLESPVHLAVKGRYKECETSFIKVFGDNDESRKDVIELIDTQRKIRESKLKRKDISILSQLLDRAFLKALFIVSVLTVVVDCSGIIYIKAYAIDFMTQLTKDSSKAVYCSVGADALATVALFLSCIIVKVFQRRTLVITFGTLSIGIMFSIGFINYFIADSVLASWLTVIVILFHYFFVNLSLIPVSFILFGELFPFEFRGIGSCISGVLFSLCSGFTLKIAPSIVINHGVAGLYVICGLIMLVFLGILYVILPETKDKTLQEVENEIRRVKASSNETEQMLSSKETKAQL